MKKNLQSYLIYLRELEKINETLFSLYGDSNNLYNHKIGVYKIFRALTLNFRFIYETADISSKQTVITLARTIIDHYSILSLLSCYSTRNEQSLRYYLYLMESLYERIKIINDFSSNLDNVDPEILKGNSDSNSHDEYVINRILQIIKEQKLDLLVEESVILSYNWRFPSEYPAGNKRIYNWQELYNIAKIPRHFSKAIQNHFSSFTHGLGLTILYSEDTPEATIYVYDFIAIIQTLTGKIMTSNYTKELEKLEFNEEFVSMGEEGWNNWK